MMMTRRRHNDSKQYQYSISMAAPLATCLLLGGDPGHPTQLSFPALLPTCTAAGLFCDFITKGPALCRDRLLGLQGVPRLYAGGIRLVIIFADGYTQVPNPALPASITYTHIHMSTA